MIEIHLYGLLREIVPDSRADENTILYLEYKEGEIFSDLLIRLDWAPTAIGDCFVNGCLASANSELKDGDRIGLFPFNMVLIDGGMYIKHWKE